VHKARGFLRAEKTGNHSKKKTFTYSEKCEVKRYLYILLLIIFVIALNVTNIIFVDESGINAYYQREYARAKRGMRVQDTKRGKRYRRTNMIAGLWGKKHIAVQCYEHATTSAFFEDWFEFELFNSAELSGNHG